MPPSIHNPTFWLFLFVCANIANCWDINHVLKIPHQFADINLSRITRNSENETLIWMEYEFNTGAGNREELIMTDIFVRKYANLPETVTNWQSLDVNGINYLFGVQKSIFYVYKLNRDTAVVYDSIIFDLEDTILTFRVINLHSELDAAVVFCVESNSGNMLRWYRLKDGNVFQFFWSWSVQKRIKDMKFIEHEKPYKILLLSDDELHSGLQTFIDVYGFIIDFSINTFDFWFHDRLFVPRSFGIQICPIYESSSLAVQGMNDISLYEYRPTTEGRIFQKLQTIESYNLKNFVCFESGYLQFLATSGPEAGLFHFVDGEFQFNTESEHNFDVSEISRVTNVNVDTYRNESLLLVQLKNSTVMALAWEGLNFKRISLPNNILDQFDLSMITPLPKYGFILGNQIVKLNVQLKNTEHPIQSSIERLLILQSLLNDSLNHQERILDETKARLEKSYLRNPIITGVWNVSTVNATNAIISDNVTYHSITIGGTTLTKEDLTFDADSFAEKLKNVSRKLDEIDSNLMNTIEHNLTDPLSDSDFTIFGNINVTGNLYVRNLTALSINDINETIVFDSIEAEDLTVHSMNGIPIENIQFGDSIVDYSAVDFYKINRAQVNGNLFFSVINGIDWTTLMKNIVWKHETMYIPGNTIIEGTLISDIFELGILNNLLYPTEYVLENSDTSVIITGTKSFDSMLLSRLENVTTLNDVNFEDYVILYKDNILKEEIAFENIKIDGEFRLDGEIPGISMEDRLLLNETSKISSDVMFFNLNVLGNVTFDTLFMNKRVLNLEDLLLKTDKEIKITGIKTFLKNVGIKSNVTITSGMVNGYFLDEFATLDTVQDFPNLTKILSNVTFGNVTFGAMKKLKAFFKENTNSNNCLDRIIVFKSPIIVDQLSFDGLNNNVSFDVFNQKVNEIFQNVSFENLMTETLLADKITPKVVNGLDFANFTKHLEFPNIGAIDQLETDRLNAKFINGMSLDEISLLTDRLGATLDSILNGSKTLNSLQVTGMVITKLLNGNVLADLYTEDEIDTVIFKSDVVIKNLTILDFMNGFNFSERVLDTVLKSETNIVIDAHKMFDTIICHQLEATALNGHPIENILDPFKEQVLTGPVIVNGSVTILKEFNTTGSIGDVPFYNLIKKFKHLGNNSYELHGDVRFLNDVTIKNLYTNGLIQGKNFDHFLTMIMFNNKDNLTVSGTKVFENTVIFNDTFIVQDKLNDIDLKRFQEKVVFIDTPFFIESKIIFRDGIKIEKDLVVWANLTTKSIMGIDVNDLHHDVLNLNRPNYIEGTTTFTDVNFQSDIQVEKFNHLDMNLLIPLDTEQSIEFLKCDNITVDKMQILGRINDVNLQEVQYNTFMMTGDQKISGHFNFRGNVHVRQNFNAHIINGIDPKSFIPLNSKGSINGNFIFERPIFLNQSLRVLGYLNGIDPARWEAVAVTTNNLVSQFISGKWVVFGNVYFEKGASGNDMLNGTNITELSNTLAKEHLGMNDVLAEKSANLDSMCEDLRELKRYAEKQIYKFNAFDYLQVIKFHSSIVSVHHFELDDFDYIILSYTTCHMHMYSFTGTKFELVVNISDFGVVEQWTTYKYDQALYFLTSGPSSCGRSPTNLWKLKDDTFRTVTK
ncbi:female sterile (1) Nasrat isoform X2 [Bombus vancouverensis nearcticus]|uniref:female sterile (1) Nasrat isoform X2 n=1 Tax=Bombus vancouverensis nearcticus TaxID=2705178 RepID=UPI00402BBB97